MTSSLYNLALDFSKELNYTKAIMARQGDKGITVTVKPFLNGLQMDTSGGTFTLKGTTPSNRYVDSVATSVTSEEVTFSLDGTFMSEAGYYKHCYAEYRKDDQILTTQDIIFFSLGVSDISQGQADEYVSQLEELIRKYNETFDAFMAEIKGRVDSLNQQITDLTGQAKTLQDKLDALKEEISKLGNLHVMYSNSIEKGDTRTPNIEQYKYRGIGMRDSNNPKDYVWDLAPEYVEDNLATDVKISEITGKANNYTDGKVSEVTNKVTQVNSQLEEHVSNTNNPHEVTKNQVGLGNVDNYSTATTADAILGISSNNFMTPKGTNDFYNSHRSSITFTGEQLREVKSGTIDLTRIDNVVIMSGSVDTLDNANSANNAVFQPITFPAGYRPTTDVPVNHYVPAMFDIFFGAVTPGGTLKLKIAMNNSHKHVISGVWLTNDEFPR